MYEKTCVFIGGKQIGVRCLRSLLKTHVKPRLVLCNLDDDGKDSWHESLAKTALAAGLRVLQGKRVSDPHVTREILEQKPGIIFCIGGMQLIPVSILQNSGLGCLNIHPALLPKYRGRYSTAHAIFNGETETGVTVHWMDEGIDSGPIIMQEKFPILEDDTARTVYDKFTATGAELFGRFLELWLSDRPIVSHPQDESQATYYPKGLPNGGKIDWSWDGRKIRNFIRAMTFESFPPPSFHLGLKEMVIVDKRLLKQFEQNKNDSACPHSTLAA